MSTHTQSTVVTKTSDGNVKEVSKVDVPEIETPKVQSIVVKVEDKALLKRCLAVYERREKNKVKSIEELIEFGLLFNGAKQSVSNNNKVFGNWREETFPGMTAVFISRCIYIMTYKTSILDWIKNDSVNDRNYSSPMAVYAAFNRYKNAQKDVDEPEPEADTPEPETGQKDKDKPLEVQDPPKLEGIPVERKAMDNQEFVEILHRHVNEAITRMNEGKINAELKEKMIIAYNSWTNKMIELDWI